MNLCLPWKVVEDLKDLLLQSKSELSARANATDFPESAKKKNYYTSLGGFLAFLRKIEIY